MIGNSDSDTDIVAATRGYERWLAQRIELVGEDLELKHAKMREEPFAFFRATFYRWLQHWRSAAGPLATAPAVWAVGDLHVENYGTWRDTEGRLAWGINDFDEAAPLPYTHDLVRLAASVHFADRHEDLATPLDEACSAILAGYRTALAAGGTPFVLEERHDWLRQAALGGARDPVKFWGKFEGLPSYPQPLPRGVRKLLLDALPAGCLGLRIVHRTAGLGSLGRRRFAAFAEWRGGWLAREAKARAPSAWDWVLGTPRPGWPPTRAWARAARAPDPALCVSASGKWQLRRLAPTSFRIELAELPKKKDEKRLLAAMGAELGNVHAGTRKALPAVLADLERRDEGWLAAAADAFARRIEADWDAWRAA